MLSTCLNTHIRIGVPKLHTHNNISYTSNYSYKNYRKYQNIKTLSDLNNNGISDKLENIYELVKIIQ